MMQQSNFTGFDFSSPVWVIYNGHTAPLLNAFLTPLTVTATNQSQTYDGGTFGLSGATYSVAGADSSGHLFGLTSAYDGAVDVGTYSPDLWSDQQGYRITYVGGTLTITPKALTLSGLSADNKVYDGTAAATVASFGSLSGIVSSDRSASWQRLQRELRRCQRRHRQDRHRQRPRPVRQQCRQLHPGRHRHDHCRHHPGPALGEPGRHDQQGL